MDLNAVFSGRVSAKLTLGDSDIWGLFDTGSKISTLPDVSVIGISDLKSTGVMLERIVGFQQTAPFRVGDCVWKGGHRHNQCRRRWNGTSDHRARYHF